MCATVVRPTLCGNRRRVLTMQPTPLDPVASERLSHAGKVFTSDLSINEFALLHGAGFEPIELVMGVSVYHVGYQFTGIRQQSELPVLTDATYRARWNAMSRMQAEADSLVVCLQNSKEPERSSSRFTLQFRWREPSVAR